MKIDSYVVENVRNFVILYQDGDANKTTYKFFQEQKFVSKIEMRLRKNFLKLDTWSSGF